MTTAEELEIIKKVLDGEREAFEELVRENEKRVYNLALKLMGNEEDALDIAQEAFIKAYTSLGAFRGESRLSVWLYRLTYNLCIDQKRKERRQRGVSLTYMGEDGEAEELVIADERKLPEEEAIRRERREAITESIGELGGKYREIIIMREIGGMSYTEIGTALGIGEGTVKSRLARARKRLAGILREKGTFPEYDRQKGEREEGERE